MAKNKAPAVVDEDVELAELVDDEETEAPKSNGQQAVTFGVADLAKHLSKESGKEIKTRDLRTQIRRMAREENARVDREITPGNRTRYDWPKGLKDPEVKAIIAAVKGGEIEAGKKEALDALKARKTEKKGKGEKKNKKSKTVVEELEDDSDDDE